jgi:hypothetical protein
MPPRYAYWTILVDDQATAFRSGSQEDLMPTFKRLKEKHPSATMMWFQNGKLWPSRIDAQEAMRARGELGRRGDERQGGFRDRERRPSRDRSEKPDWKPKSFAAEGERKSAEKLDWKPKGEFTPAPKRSERPDWKPKTSYDRDHKPSRSEKPDWKPKGSFDRDSKPAWKPKGSFDRERKPDWKPKGSYGSKPAGRREWTPRDEKPRSRSVGANFPAHRSSSEGGSSPAGERKERGDRLEWTPKSQAPGPKSPEKRKWVPKEEYKKSMGIEAKRDGKWRPGGEHRDPRQKYKDAKKAKWTKIKKTIRTKWETKKKKP